MPRKQAPRFPSPDGRLNAPELAASLLAALEAPTEAEAIRVFKCVRRAALNLAPRPRGRPRGTHEEGYRLESFAIVYAKDVLGLRPSEIIRFLRLDRIPESYRWVSRRLKLGRELVGGLRGTDAELWAMQHTLMDPLTPKQRRDVGRLYLQFYFPPNLALIPRPERKVRVREHRERLLRLA